MANTQAGRATSTKGAPKTEAKTGLTAALLTEGKGILKAFTPEVSAALGIREKTARKTGTRAAMLAVAAYGYEQGRARLLVQAVRAAMGLDPNVGGIDMPWMEKEVNMATITPSARIRQQKDGKMKLVPITKATTKKVAKPKIDTDRTNGPVIVRKEVAAEAEA